MSVRPHPSKGPGHWQIDIGYGKSRTRIAVHGTKDEAIDMEKGYRRKRGHAPASTDPRLREITEDYLNTYKLDHLPAGYEKQKTRVALINSFFGQYSLSSIDPPLIEEYKRRRLGDGLKPTTINKELSALSGCLKWAQENNKLENLPRIKRFPPKLCTAPTPMVPTGKIMREIINEINPRVRELFRLTFMTGIRPSEAVALRKENWHPELSVISVVGKGNKQRIIPITNQNMRDELNRRSGATKSGYLWESHYTGTKYVDIRHSLKSAAKRAGWTSASIYHHLLRHAAGTDHIALGTDIRVVQQLFGHSTIKVTEIYTHIHNNTLVEAQQRREEPEDRKPVTGHVTKKRRK
jgi:integrase/recombinase XerD